jgi:chemotaxis protein CheC
MKKLSDLEIDALREMTSIGTAHAATALSELSAKQVKVEVPGLKLIEVTQISEALGGGEQEIVGLYFKISGHIAGSILIFLTEPASKELVNIILEGEGSKAVRESEAMAKSALMEVGNILSNAYLNALADLISMKILLSVPHLANDTLSSVIDFLIIDMIKPLTRLFFCKQLLRWRTWR